MYLRVRTEDASMRIESWTSRIQNKNANYSNHDVWSVWCSDG